MSKILRGGRGAGVPAVVWRCHCRGTLGLVFMLLGAVLGAGGAELCPSQRDLG